MSFQDRAIRVGGYFTAALLPMNVFLSDVNLVTAVIVSLAAGVAFTAGGLAFGKRYNLK